MRNYENLITYIQSKSSTKIIVSAIIPRPCDLSKNPKERRVKDMNKELKFLCKRRKFQFLHMYRIFLHGNKPIRSYYAVNDQGLHLNLEGTRKLRSFLLVQFTVYRRKGSYPFKTAFPEPYPLQKRSLSAENNHTQRQ